MSSLKHSVHRRVHLERATPANRIRFGILERKKDYKIRAARYHEKENLFKSLSEKARTRNPDEFDFKMVNSKLENGRYKKVDNDSLLSNNSMTPEEKKLVESQNLNYINYRKSIDNKKIERLEKELTLFGGNFQRNHVFFNDEDETKKKNDGVFNNNQLDNVDYLSDNIVEYLTKSYRILNNTIDRSKNLERVSNYLELQKNLRSRGKKRKVINKDGKSDIVWYPIRKK